MPHVVTGSCCADASCVLACPVNCIRPTPDEPDFGVAEMLHIDPAVCVDCGACVTACPVDAIVPDRVLAPEELLFSRLNAELVTPGREQRVLARPSRIVRLAPRRAPLRVAVVGSGPASMYAADELLRQPGVEVTILERAAQPFGLARFGVAPDHPRTRGVTELFRTIERRPGLTLRTGVEVGRDVTPAELAEQYDAVVYGHGASADRGLGIPGRELPGCLGAAEVVGWYTGHPDGADVTPALDTRRAVVVGTGNVALDIARILATDPARLAETAIAPAALAALRGSRIEEVVLLGRRGPAEAAFTLPELAALAAREDLDVTVEGLGPATDPVPKDSADTTDPTGLAELQSAARLRLLRELAERAPRGGRRRIVLRFHSSPVEVLGDGVVTGLRVQATEVVTGADGLARAVPVPGSETELGAGLVVTAVGHTGRELPGLPFDPATGTVPNLGGRVLDGPAGQIVPRTYVLGWAKRGPSGFIGTNKHCSLETVNALLSDANEQAGRPRSARQ